MDNWVLKEHTYKNQEGYKVGQTEDPNRRRYKKQEPFVCDKCHKVWHYTENNIYIEYVTDFPKIGCTPNTCDRCKKES